ncbi:MAG: hypothetical protein ACYC1U_03985 [Candidatus Aquicultorales bacterium]
MALRHAKRGFTKRNLRTRAALPKLGIVSILSISLGLLEATVAEQLGRGTLALRASRLTLDASFGLLGSNTLDRLLTGSELTIEITRTAVIFTLLAGIALLAGKAKGQRAAVFLWVGGSYLLASYAARYALSSWPGSITAPDLIIGFPRSILVPVYVPLALGFLMMGTSLFLLKRSRGTRLGRVPLNR